MVPPSSYRISRVPHYLICFSLYLKYGTITLYSQVFQSLFFYTMSRRLFPFRSPLLRESLLMSFPRGTEMFHFSRFASYCYDTYLLIGGFPHSDIAGSQDIAASPTLFAGCHVFLRLWLPRHPPYALNYLTIQPQIVLGCWSVTFSPMFTLDSVLFISITTFIWDNIFCYYVVIRLIICWN